MFDTADTPALQRSTGQARVALAGRPPRLTALQQSGAAKAFLPRVHGARPEVVFLNTSGGLTGGDRLAFDLTLAPGTAAIGTTQTAERAYAAAGGVARMEVALTLGSGAALDWLPQETILYQASALSRRTVVRMAGDARLVWAEMLVLGRAAMGETVTALDLTDRREIHRGGQRALLEPVRLTAAALAGPGGARPALTAGARAFASVVMMAPGAEAALDPLRAALPADGVQGVTAGASAWDGRVVARFAAADGLPLRRAVAAALAVLRGGTPPPRVWQL